MVFTIPQKRRKLLNSIRNTPGMFHCLIIISVKKGNICFYSINDSKKCLELLF